MRYENEKMEFKEIFVNDIYKEVIAFANTRGGTICVGVNDEGESVGLADIDSTYTCITNGIRDAISPDITMFVKYVCEEGIIRIEVSEGSFKPYYLKAKGLKPAGVYVRQGTSSVPASPDQIRQMIKNADGDMYEDLRSLEQKLSFGSAEKIFAKHNVPFGSDKYYALGIKNFESALYTNLGQILSDQCVHTVKIAVFEDLRNTVFVDRKEFKGSVFEQLESAFAYLKLCNRNRSVIDGLERHDYMDYPDEAIREALLNALIHRDYSFSGSIIINVNDQQMEFISLGGLFAGLSKEDIQNGISMPRNEKLAEVFHRLQFIEAYGTGIRRIYTLYEGHSRQPDIVVTANSFRIILPNMNASDDPDARKENHKSNQRITPQVEKILDYVETHGDITDDEVQQLLNVKKTRAYTLMKQMEEDGMIHKSGRGARKKYLKNSN